MNYSEKIKQLRKEYNLTQSELANKLFVTRQAVSLWEQGKVEPSKDTLILIKEIFNISVDEWLETNDLEINNKPKNIKVKINYKKIIYLLTIILGVIIIIIGTINIISRINILNPKGYEKSNKITRKETLIINKGNSETIVFEESGKPLIKCDIPNSYNKDTSKEGIYINNNSFIKFNSEYENKTINPLYASKYYSIYENKGYTSYIDMTRKAMYIDLQKVNIFSSKEKILLAGGAKIIRNHICANNNAQYYEIDGGLNEDLNIMRLYGFALHFEDNVWFIFLKNNDKYYYISIKDPQGIGKSSETICKFISTINTTNN